MASVMRVGLSLRESGLGVVVLGYQITAPIGLKDGEETKDQAGARKAYVEHLDTVVRNLEELSTFRSLKSKVSPK